MHNYVHPLTVDRIANAKGLKFAFSEKDNGYVMYDKITGEVLMTYATITVQSIVNEKIWREECNKLKAQSFR